MSDHTTAIYEVMEEISNAWLTLNPEKCKFGSKKDKFWGMIINVDGMQPDPAKIDALNFITALTNKDEHISFSCMQGIIQKKSASGSRTLPLVIFDKKVHFFHK